MADRETSIHPAPGSQPIDLAFLLLTSFFVGSLVIAAVLAVKIVGIWKIVVPAGVIAYSLTFLVTDTICEVWGKRTANYVVLAGFITLSIVFFLIWVAIRLPGAVFWKDAGAYNTVLNQGLRIIIGSLAAYIVSQFHDVWSFHFWRKLTRARHLWLRNNLSTMASQLIDTVVFILVAFAGTGAPVFTMIWGQYVAKIIIAAADTPVVYLLVFVLKRRRPGV
jgi:uncharacterized integral membrane protein (TIGR00697 family)